MTAAPGRPADPNRPDGPVGARPAATRARVGRKGATANLDDLGPVYDDPRLAEPLTVREVQLDPRAMRVTVRGRPLPSLPPKEFELLHLLMLNAGRLCRRDALIAQVWGPGHDAAGQTLNVHILRLRRKLETDDSQPRYIRTVRGVGYIFDA
jgi:DNA-binding response OmpR family regulator